MHVITTNSKHAHLQTLALNQTAVTGGFWSHRQTINRKTSLKRAFNKLEASGNFNNLKLVIGTGEGEYSRPLFMDSDIYKWLEAVSYELANGPDAELEAMANEVIGLLGQAQRDDGYLNSFYQFVEPEKQWLELAMGHELYCAGHLFEAAVAHHRATGQTSLLDIACRFADYIETIFGPDKRDGVPGHPEIELAMVELYRETGRQSYLDLAEFFVGQRGQGKMIGRTPFQADYHQDRVPVREASVVEGHAVRQLYLTAGIADLYLETGDPALLGASERLWRDMTAHKMHITAGLGARHYGESFGDAYQLPSDTCYCETCAAIANIMWNWRMLLITGEARYADLLERSLYNGFLSGISLDGQRYFYVNPLLSRGNIERPEWYGCACCPPNVMRLIASLGHYIATTNETGVQIHQYASATLTTDVATFHLDTNYPHDGQVKLTLSKVDSRVWTVALRIPSWCSTATIQVNGEVIDTPANGGTYAQIKRAWQPGDVIELDLTMKPQLIEAHPKVDAIRGCLAIQRGPLVYCLEGIDQPNEVDLSDVCLAPDSDFKMVWQADLLDGVTTIATNGSLVNTAGWDNTLYRTVKEPEETTTSISLTAIPYYAWANRGGGTMRVWIPKQTR